MSAFCSPKIADNIHDNLLCDGVMFLHISATSRNQATYLKK